MSIEKRKLLLGRKFQERVDQLHIDLMELYCQYVERNIDWRIFGEKLLNLFGDVFRWVAVGFHQEIEKERCLRTILMIPIYKENLWEIMTIVHAEIELSPLKPSHPVWEYPTGNDFMMVDAV